MNDYVTVSRNDINHFDRLSTSFAMQKLQRQVTRLMDLNPVILPVYSKTRHIQDLAESEGIGAVRGTDDCTWYSSYLRGVDTRPCGVCLPLLLHRLKCYTE